MQTVNSHNFQVFRLIFWMTCWFWNCHRLVVGSTSSKSATFTSAGHNGHRFEADPIASEVDRWRMAGKRQETHLLALRCSFDRKWMGFFDQLLKLLTVNWRGNCGVVVFHCKHVISPCHKKTKAQLFFILGKYILTDMNISSFLFVNVIWSFVASSDIDCLSLCRHNFYLTQIHCWWDGKNPKQPSCDGYTTLSILE